MSAPILLIIIAWIRSLWGEYTGQYIAYTFSERNYKILIESVICKNVKNSVKGSIEGVSSFTINKDDNSIFDTKENIGFYKFHGLVENRLLNAFYKTTTDGQISSGTISLKNDFSGKFMVGATAGFVVDKIIHTKTIWVKLKNRINLKKSRYLFIEESKKILPEILLIQSSCLKDIGIEHIIDTPGQARGPKSYYSFR